MSGISRIQSRRDGVKSPSSNAPQRRELWFKDGDQAFITSVATGDDGDTMFDEVWLYTFKDGQRWTTLLADKDVDTSSVPDGRSDYIWNQVLDVFNDWGQKLDGGVMRVKRTGTGMYDTSYTVTATARDTEVPAEKETEKGDLPTVKGYFKMTYGGDVVKPKAVSVKEGEEKGDSTELF